ncbi:anaerobic benzoate catabolism transcriptional regulator [compost metagenome]
MLIIVCSIVSFGILDLCILELAMKSNSQILIKFGEQVRDLRKRKGISQEELAYKSELHRTYIGMIERAEKNITLLNIEKIAKALEIDIKQLFDGSESL